MFSANALAAQPSPCPRNAAGAGGPRGLKLSQLVLSAASTPLRAFTRMVLRPRLCQWRLCSSSGVGLPAWPPRERTSCLPGCCAAAASLGCGRGAALGAWARLTPAEPCTACRAAVTDRTTGVVIPPIDPAFPDPLNTVNVSVLNTPNARAEGRPPGSRMLEPGGEGDECEGGGVGWPEAAPWQHQQPAGLSMA